MLFSFVLAYETFCLLKVFTSGSIVSLSCWNGTCGLIYLIMSSLTYVIYLHYFMYDV